MINSMTRAEVHDFIGFVMKKDNIKYIDHLYHQCA